MEIKPVNPIQCGPLTIGDGRLTLIAGPCMAETLEVCLETAEFLKNLTAELNVQYIFKASYDKANRTSNDSKRGPGMERGLEMLAEVKTRFDVPVITDVHEHEDHYEVDIDLPGFTKDEIKVSLENGYMTISAAKGLDKDEQDKKSGRYIRKERYAGSCERSFYVGEDITEEDIKGEFKHGILKLFVPKKEAKPAVEQKKYVSIEG